MPHSMLAVLVALFAMLGTLPPAWATNAQSDPTVSVLDLARAFPGRLDGQPGAPDFERMGDYLLGVLDQLFIIDASDPARPRFARSFRPVDAGRIDYVEVVGTTAWLGGDRLIAVDLSDPRAPVEIARFSPRFRTGDMALGVVDRRVLLVLRSGRLFEILDVTDPHQPVYRGDFEGDASSRLAFIDDRMILAGSMLEIFDLADPDNPASMGRLTLDGAARSLDVADGIAYVTGEPTGLALVDVSDPFNPNIIGRYAATNAHFVRASGGVALLGTTGTPDGVAVQVLDIRNPASIVPLRSYPGTWMRDAAFFGRYAMLSDGRSPSQPLAVTTLDLSHPGGSALLGDPWQAPSVITPDIATIGSFAFVAVDGRPQALTVLHYPAPDDPSNPIVVATVNPQQAVARMEVTGDLLVLQTSDSLEVWSIADPAAPVRQSVTFVGGRPRALAVSAELVFLIEGCGDELRIYDTSDPTNPTLLSATSQLCPTALDAAGRIVIAGAGRAVHIIDASDPTAPVRAGEYRADQAIDALLAHDHPTEGPIGYVLTAGRLVTLSLADPADPLVLFESPALYPGDAPTLHREGDLLVINPADLREKYLVDVSDPLETTLIGTFYHRPALDVEWLEDALLLSTPGNNLRRLDFRPHAACDADLDGNGRLDVFDFLEFINRFNRRDPASDYSADGMFTLMDFLAYQDLFTSGC